MTARPDIQGAVSQDDDGVWQPMVRLVQDGEVEVIDLAEAAWLVAQLSTAIARARAFAEVLRTALPEDIPLLTQEQGRA